MVGRGIFYDPLLFRTDGRRFEELPPAEKVKMMTLHLREQQRVWEGLKGYDLVKSFYKIYTRGWEGGEELRDRLYQTRSYTEATEILEQWLL
jgi:tRNA-dihydrouridine synthase